jgi:Ca2+-transporting ATPase
MKKWHTASVVEVMEGLGVSLEKGLSGSEASQRQARLGPNELIDRGGKSIWKILLEQLIGVMTLVLIISAIISVILKDYEDALAILAIVILNTILGFTQEYRAENAMAALRKMTVPNVKVRRDAHVQELSARQLVPGDIIFLEAGNAVPADARLAESANLRVQEAVLTGESEPVEKFTDALTDEDLQLGDQRNRVFMGTVVTYGRGLGIVTDIGQQTELGKIAEMIQAVGQESTPLQRRLEELAKSLALVALGIVAVVFILGIIRGEDLRLMFLTAISLAVAAVPEGLPTVVTIALALGAQRLLNKQALIRKLPAVETLGSVTVICTDKTGTLTENRMTVNVLDVAGHRIDLSERLREFSPATGLPSEVESITEYPAIRLLLAGGALCNDAILEQPAGETSGFVAVGDPTEGALVIAAAHFGLLKKDLESHLPRLAEVPFDSDRKRMTTLHSSAQADLKPFFPAIFPASFEGDGQPYLTFTKGAVDGLLDVCNRVWVNDHVEPLAPEWIARIQRDNDRLAQEGARVLGVAFRFRSSLTTQDPGDPVERELVFIGLIGMIDPARPEVKPAVQTAQNAGIRTIMITGDHPLTAAAIAHDLGIKGADQVLTGRDLAGMPPEALVSAVGHTNVFARVSPEHKLKVVEALQSLGQVVAMTGDGVNDAPALKKANIGVSMGITGTDVAKGASDMVLLDDNFATIVSAVEEGRRIFDNIRKFIKYALGSNTGEILLMVMGPLLGMPLPLLPLQILWVNLVTDGLPGLALTVEPAEHDTMKRPPYQPHESIFAHGLGRHIVWVGVLICLVCLGLGYWAWQDNRAGWQTMVFTTLTLAQMGHVLAIRSRYELFYESGLFSNKPLLGAVLLTFFLQLGVIYLPIAQEFFSTVPLTAMELLACIALSLVVFLAIELEKWIARKTKS